MLCAMALKRDQRWRQDMLCAMALKSGNGRQIHHTQTGLRVCREQALKGAGERNTHGGGGGGGGRCGDRRETPPAREVALRGGVEGLCMV
jgi:hypothetical protein